MTREEQLEVVNRLLEKDPKQPMEKDEIRIALSLMKAQKEVIKTMRIKQRMLPKLQDQSEMGKLIREQQKKTLTDLLESKKKYLKSRLNNS